MPEVLSQSGAPLFNVGILCAGDLITPSRGNEASGNQVSVLLGRMEHRVGGVSCGHYKPGSVMEIDRNPVIRCSKVQRNRKLSHQGIQDQLQRPLGRLNVILLTNVVFLSLFKSRSSVCEFQGERPVASLVGGGHDRIEDEKSNSHRDKYPTPVPVDSYPGKQHRRGDGSGIGKSDYGEAGHSRPGLPHQRGGRRPGQTGGRHTLRPLPGFAWRGRFLLRTKPPHDPRD